MMSNYAIQRIPRLSIACVLLAALATPALAIEFKTSDGAWTFTFSGEVNVDYIWSNCQSVASAAAVGGGLTCVGTLSGNDVSNIGNGLLPASFAFGVATTQGDYDLSAHLGLFPGIATNNGGSPNSNNPDGSSNAALGTTGLDLRQVYLTFGNKDMGTFTFGRNIGLFGADVILNDMTLPGVGAPGTAAGPAPTNTTLGGIGFGYIYTDWLAQIDYTTPDLSGFALTLGIFDPLNSLSDDNPGYATAGKKAPGVHGKITYTLPLGEGSKLYLSVAGITQEQNYYYTLPLVPAGIPTTYEYRGTGGDIFAKLDVQSWELIGYYYRANGLGTTALFNLGSFGVGQGTRVSEGYLFQTTYKFGALKVGANYGVSSLDYANAADAAANPNLVSSNKKGTVGLYYSLTKNLMLLAEGTETKSHAQSGGSNSATTVNLGAYLEF